MTKVFTYADKPTTAASVVGCAKASGAEVYALALTQEEADALTDVGADGVVYVTNAVRPIESNAKGVAALLHERGADAFLVGASAQGRDFAAQTAAYCDAGLVSDVSAIELGDGELSATRGLYGGAVVENSVVSYPAIATLQPGVGDKLSGSASIEEVTIELDDRIKLVEEHPIEKGGVSLDDARVIVSIGMGVQKEGDLAMFEELADALGGAIACTRGIAEERHWLPIEQYIGISGAQVAPDLYLAFGMSGQVQHIAGIRGSKIIVAVNTDASAPIFRTSDYGVVGDLYEVVPKLVAAMK